MKALVVTLALTLALIGALAVTSLSARSASAATPWVYVTNWCVWPDNSHYGSEAHYTGYNPGNDNYGCWADGKGPLKAN